MNYAAMAAKPAMPVEKETIQKNQNVVLNIISSGVSWADMCDEDDDDAWGN